MASNLNGFLALCDFECSKKAITIQTFSNSWMIVPVQHNSHQQSRLNQHQSSLCITCLRSGRFRPSKHYWSLSRTWKIMENHGKSWTKSMFSKFSMSNLVNCGLGTSSSSWLPELMRLANWSCTSPGLRGTGAWESLGNASMDFNGSIGSWLKAIDFRASNCLKEKLPS